MSGVEDAPPPAPLCQQCSENSAKYKCPRCAVRTCSLECSTAHKAEAGCSGQRDRAAFVKKADYDANTMMSDYGFLQDLSRDHTLALRAAEEQGISTKELKGRAGQGPPARTANSDSGPPSVTLNRAQRLIATNAKDKRQVMIRYMSPGIKRHQQNRTSWVTSKSRLVWTVEFAVPEITSSPNSWVETGFHDVCRLGDLWSRLLKHRPGSGRTDAGGGDGADGDGGPRKRIRDEAAIRTELPSDDGKEYPFKSALPLELHQTLVREFEDVSPDELVWLIRVQDIPANKPTFCKIDPAQPLYTQLRYQTVLEFPTIYVYRHAPDTLHGHPVTIEEPYIASDSSSAQSSSEDTDTDAAESATASQNAEDANVQ